MLTSRSLRILEVSEPNKNGVFIHVRGLLNHLLRSGHCLTYAYSSTRSSSQLDALLVDLHTARGASVDFEISNGPSLRDSFAWVWILWHIYAERPDIVHGHSSKAGALVRFAAMVMPTTAYIYTPHAYYSMSARPDGWRMGYWLIERVLAPWATTINISRDERRFAVNALKLGRAKAVIAPNPVELNRFRPVNAERKWQVRAQWSIPASANVFGTLARFGEQKDLGTFYRAAIHCAKSDPLCHFIHLGTGKDADFYQQEVCKFGVATQFTFIDYLADPEPFYACLDAFVITSKFEAGWPIVMLEALALGLPLITTDFVGLGANDPRELSHITIVPVGDDHSLAKSISAVAADLRLAPPRINHREYVESHFAPNVCYGQVEQLYDNMTKPSVIV
ncbi:MAG: glycosyltransferase [Opitutus sp.]|nr:glycosyltransferase [Opitutus sp.]MCS6277665.1 glycosyltransferase [Opitutus sp.]MCS6300783.1 glycosyltransferase [Opitutus sp.]